MEYQNITGFGGMNNVWAAGTLSIAEVEKMYSADGLSYNMMRIMIWPNKADWGRDVATTLKAQSLGARILASPWTPPSDMKSSKSNLHGYLLPEKYADYVNHLNEFIAFMKDRGVNIEAVSIQNEPDWSPEYDGCEWTPEQILNFVKNHAGNINAKVLAAEAVNFKKMYTDPVLNDPAAVNNLDIVGGHLYGGGLQDYPLARAKGKEIWMTEHLLNEVNDGMGWAQALVMAKELNDCMENNFNAYFWWYLKRSYSMLGDGDKGTTMGETLKRGYVLSHYAKFATGRKRIQADKIADNSEVSITSYHNAKDITLVIVNSGSKAVPTLKINLPIAVKSGEAVQTTESANMVGTTLKLDDTKKSAMVNLPAKSIVSIKFIK
ncbi:MAG: cellulose-binding protein [Pedobacter sp.]|nr:MAG: cellulose-binding protein [Pedobacter sp.]